LQNQQDEVKKAINTSNEWTALIQSLQLTGTAKQLALKCEFKKRENNTIYLVSLPGCPSSFFSKKVELEQALQRHYGESIQLNLQPTYAETASPAEQQRIQETRAQAQREAASIAMENDPFIEQMKTVFNAQLGQMTPLQSNDIS
jgi:hypothetical protein